MTHDHGYLRYLLQYLDESLSSRSRTLALEHIAGQERNQFTDL